MMISNTFVLLSFTPGLLLSAALGIQNDWRVPCFQGECSHVNGSSLLRINGSPDRISDITTAGGWTILDCNSTAMEQEIRLVCHSSECEHLNQNGGPTDKLVRLPENCGSNPFARVAAARVSENQTLPAELATSLRRRDGTTPNVTSLTLDVDFGAADPSKAGNVTFTFQGSNVPGSIPGSSTTPNQTVPAHRVVRHSRFSRRFQTSDKISHAFFSKSGSKNLAPIDIDQSFTLFDTNISCPLTDNDSFSASVKADIAATAHVQASVGVVMSGSIIPPKLDECGITIGLDADLGATLEIVGNAVATVDSGKFDLLPPIPIAGFTVKGILEIGPSFTLKGQATANLDIDASAKIGLSYKATNAQLTFPISDTAPSGFGPADNSIQLSVSPSQQSKASISAHLIPGINVGLSVFKAGASVFFDLDASSTATLTLDSSSPTNGSASTGVDGCVDIGTELDVNAGADASFFGLFSEGKTFTLFSKKFDLFNKCFGQASSNARRDYPWLSQAHPRTSVGKRDITCPSISGLEAKLVSLVDQTISGSSLTPQSK